MNGQVSLRGGGVVANLAPIRLVPTSVRFSPCQSRMGLIGQTIDAVHFVFRMLFLHVDLKSFLVLVVPVAFRTLECLT